MFCSPSLDDRDKQNFLDASFAIMKKHLKWKIEQSGGSMSCLTLPTISAEDGFMDPGLCPSPTVPGFYDACGLMSTLPYGFMACSPVLLDRLGPHILRSHVSTAQYKPIPHNDRIDLEAFRRKEPQEWNMDDVIGWMISFAKQHQIPVEDMNMHRFANCTGPLLMLMNQQNFMDRDSAYGHLLYMEFRKLIGDDSSILDDWMRSNYRDDCASASTSTSNLRACDSSVGGRFLHGHAEQPCTSAQADANSSNQLSSHIRSIQRDSVIKAAAVGQNGTGCLLGVDGSSLLSRTFNGTDTKCKSEFRDVNYLGDRSKVDGGCHSPNHHISTIPKFAYGKIKKSKICEATVPLTASGKPRKRSQHTKGNKLWEFIRDALKDSETCPSVVRWEDQNEGVFRIVESEKLARLWGEKKNNQKMTYEKLSRAMRYYYNTKILLPVSGRRLVYKFGPNAIGWKLFCCSPPLASTCCESSTSANEAITAGGFASSLLPRSITDSCIDPGVTVAATVASFDESRVVAEDVDSDLNCFSCDISDLTSVMMDDCH